jgi:hypothetical protein
VAPFVAGKNAFINGGFDFWQRGTSISNFGFFTLYTADRWNFVSVNSGRTISRQATGDTTNLPNIQYCGRFQRDSGNTDTTYWQTSQSIESTNSIPFAGKTVTLSFYARKGANYSPTSSVLTVSLSSGTGTDQQVGSYTGNVSIVNSTATLTTTWQRFTYTGTVPTNATELGMIFRADPTGTAGAADYFEVTGVQLEIGAVATPFARAGGSIGGELALCQRYYQKSYPASMAPGSFFQGGYSVTIVENNIPNNNYFHYQPLIVQTRAEPTITIYSGSGATARVSTAGGSDLAANSAVPILITDNHFTIQNQSGGALTASSGGFLFYYVASSEL